MNSEQERRDEEACQAVGQWRGRIAYMRLILCLTTEDDAIKIPFLRRGDARSRLELDALNSNVRPPTVFELIADKWNDCAYNPVAAVSEWCHKDFSATTNCAHSEVAALMRATPQKKVSWMPRHPFGQSLSISLETGREVGKVRGQACWQ